MEKILQVVNSVNSVLQILDDPSGNSFIENPYPFYQSGILNHQFKISVEYRVKVKVDRPRLITSHRIILLNHRLGRFRFRSNP